MEQSNETVSTESETMMVDVNTSQPNTSKVITENGKTNNDTESSQDDVPLSNILKKSSTDKSSQANYEETEELVHDQSSSSSDDDSSGDDVDPNDAVDILDYFVKDKTKFSSFIDMNRALYQDQNTKGYKLSKNSQKCFLKHKMEVVSKSKKKKGKRKSSKAVHSAPKTSSKVPPPASKPPSKSTKSYKKTFPAQQFSFTTFDPNDPPLRGYFHCRHNLNNQDGSPCQFQLNFNSCLKDGCKWSKKTKVEDLNWYFELVGDKVATHNHGISNEEEIDFHQKYGVPKNLCPQSVTDHDQSTCTSLNTTENNNTSNSSRPTTDQNVSTTTTTTTTSTETTTNQPPPQVFVPYVSYRPRGYRNSEDDNLCYINCAVQMLFNIPQVHTYLMKLQTTFKYDEEKESSKVMYELLLLFKQMKVCNTVETSRLSVSNLMEVLVPISSGEVVVGQQGCSMTIFEILVKVLDDVSETQGDVVRFQPMFTTTVQEITTCDQCKQSKIEERFVNRLVVHNTSNTTLTLQIDKCIDIAYGGNNISQDMKCSTCGADHTRLSYQQKITKVAKILNVSAYRGVTSRASRQYFAFKFPRTWVPNNKIMDKEKTYALTSVLYNSDQGNGDGHYTVDVKNWQNNYWHYCEDNFIKTLRLEADLPGIEQHDYHFNRNQASKRRTSKKDKGKKDNNEENEKDINEERMLMNVQMVTFIDLDSFTSFE